MGAIHDPFENAGRVASRVEFEAHVRALRVDLLENRDEWENSRLEDFLEALAAWVHDMDGYFANRGEVTPPTPTWALLAQMLCAAAVYE
jgi:hypothetical protein